MNYRKSIFLVVPLLLSGFVHFWNTIGFPPPTTDEGTYLGRAMNILEGFGAQDPYYGYDHPYFGQILLAAVYSIIGYTDSFNIADYANVRTFETLFFLPRALMGILAVLNTFLVYKISERRYNATVAFIAAILFAVMPITWLTRWIHLDSIQLPFILLSLFFAMGSKDTFARDNNKSGNKNNCNILTVFISGIFLGLAIFTKIPAFTMVLPVGYLILASSKTESNLIKTLFLWLAPVILIPLIWPMYAISVGQFDNWLFGIYEQANREKLPLSLSIKDFFQIDPMLLILGTTGIVFAAIKKDIFILLLTVPYAVFLYFVGFVTIFHLLPLIAGFSIASGSFIVDMSQKIAPRKKLGQMSPYVIIAAIGVIGIISTSVLLIKDHTSHYFEAAAYVSKYMQKATLNDDANITTVISSPFYLWIPKYKFHMDNYLEWGIRRVEAQTTISIVDNAFTKALSSNKNTDRLYKKIYELFETKKVATFGDKSSTDSITLLSTDLSRLKVSNSSRMNLVNQDHQWEPTTGLKLSKTNGSLDMLIETNITNKQFNRAVLTTNLNSVEKPVLLSLEYASKSFSGNATFLLQVKEKDQDKYWTQLLDYTSGHFKKDLFVLPDYIIGNHVEIRLTTVTEGPGEHSLVIREAIIV
jgi:4-amino-4-deoxy-L-arabinose transferase-like glycosyltransferase